VVGEMADGAALIIGNEILTGKVEEANLVVLARALRPLGVRLKRVATIPDEIDVIAEEVRALSKSHDWVFTSGGVGPTHDDVTVEGVARGLGVRVVRDPRLQTRLEAAFSGKPNDARLRMADIPEGAELLAADPLIVPVVAIRNVFV